LVVRSGRRVVGRLSGYLEGVVHRRLDGRVRLP
jgi:hypothetical protein